MTSTYIAKLGLPICKTDIGAQKIDRLTLVIYDKLIARFLLHNKLKRVRFFEKIFFLADISIEVILEMSFCCLSEVNIRFIEVNHLIWRSYNTAKALLITKRVELIDKKEFAPPALDKNAKIFMIHIAVLSALLIYLN